MNVLYAASCDGLHDQVEQVIRGLGLTTGEDGEVEVKDVYLTGFVG